MSTFVAPCSQLKLFRISPPIYHCCQGKWHLSIHLPSTPGFCGAWSSKNTTNSVVVVASFFVVVLISGFMALKVCTLASRRDDDTPENLVDGKKSIQLPRKVPFILTSSFGCSHVSSKFSCNISKGHLNFSILNQSLANGIRDKTTPFGGQRKPLPACMGAGGR